MNELALFAGVGGGLLATHHLLGWRCVGYVEMAKYPCQVLEARIRDGLLSKAPIFCCTVREFITSGFARKYRGVVDVITAGFPCQPFSLAGKRLAQSDERNGWPDTIRAIRVVRPEFIFLENVPGLIATPYFATIIRQISEAGYDAEWACFSAADVGANHKRNRVWIVGWRRDLPNPYGGGIWEQSNGIGRGNEEAELEPNGFKEPMAHTHGERKLQPAEAGNEVRNGAGNSGKPLAFSEGQRLQSGHFPQSQEKPQLERYCGALPNANELGGGNGRGKSQPSQSKEGRGVCWWAVEPGVGRVVDGMAGRVERLRAIGNGQVPAVVAHVWKALMEG